MEEPCANSAFSIVRSRRLSVQVFLECDCSRLQLASILHPQDISQRGQTSEAFFGLAVLVYSLNESSAVFAVV